jgi:hypothetical protein
MLEAATITNTADMTFRIARRVPGASGRHETPSSCATT